VILDCADRGWTDLEEEYSHKERKGRQVKNDSKIQTGARALRAWGAWAREMIFVSDNSKSEIQSR
jgi:hypothetical protein